MFSQFIHFSNLYNHFPMYPTTLVIFFNLMSLGKSVDPPNLFTFDPTPYDTGVFQGKVCFTNSSMYIPECMPDYDGLLEVGMRSSHSLNDEVKWEDSTKKYDDKNVWLAVPKLEIIVAHGYCMMLYIPMNFTKPAPSIYVVWMCECGEVNHELCRNSKDFFSQSEASSPFVLEEAKFAIVKEKTASSPTPIINRAQAQYSSNGCNDVSKTISLPDARTVVECVHRCYELTNTAEKINCNGIFYWATAGQCTAVLGYGLQKGLSLVSKDRCQYVEVKGYQSS